jgi:hypothetical protein
MIRNDSTGDELKRSVKPDAMLLIPKGTPQKPDKQIADSHVATAPIRDQKVQRRLNKAGVERNESKAPRQARKKQLPARYR